MLVSFRLRAGGFLGSPGGRGGGVSVFLDEEQTTLRSVPLRELEREERCLQ